MKKTSVYLDEADLTRIRSLAERRGTSQAEVIRAAINAYAAQMPPKRHFSLLGSFEGDGRSIADIPEDELMKGFGE